MKGLVPLFLGVFGTFAFSWFGLTVIPNLQIGALNPQADEEGTDVYPQPPSGMAVRGREVYAANGCVYCHSQQIRPDYVSADIDRKWGERRSAPRDYLFDRPVLLGQERMGPDLSNLGKRAPGEGEKSATPPAANPPTAPPAQSPPPPNSGPQKPPPGGPPTAAQSPAASPAQAKPAPPGNAPAQPSPAPAQAAANPSPSPSASPNPNGIPPLYSAAWHHRHLYAPRSVNPDNEDSTMPAYKFLYEKHPISGERSADALELTGRDVPPPGWEVVPTYDAECLVAYLMSLDQSHPLKEVKSVAASAAAGSPPMAPAGLQTPGPPPAAPKK
jgi:cbb3-type cytochrome oxidase cytochrome c subunit